jgi:hypothetical protein
MSRANGYALIDEDAGRVFDQESRSRLLLITLASAFVRASSQAISACSKSYDGRHHEQQGDE